MSFLRSPVLYRLWRLLAFGNKRQKSGYDDADLFCHNGYQGIQCRRRFWVKGDGFLCLEPGTLTLIVLLGHWIEMKLMAGTSRELEQLVQLMPSDVYMVSISWMSKQTT